jgi:transposase
MMGRLKRDQGQFFYSFRLNEAVPCDHPIRQIASVLDLSWVHLELAPFYPNVGRPSIDPELMIRMLIVGYVFAIRSERALCRDLQVNLAYRWFCGLSIEDKVPDHSAFSRARHERFRDSDIFRRVFERVVKACIAAGLVGGRGFAVDASLIVADANKQRSIPGLSNRCSVRSIIVFAAPTSACRIAREASTSTMMPNLTSISCCTQLEPCTTAMHLAIVPPRPTAMRARSRCGVVPARRCDMYLAI